MKKIIISVLVFNVACFYGYSQQWGGTINDKNVKNSGITSKWNPPQNPRDVNDVSKMKNKAPKKENTASKNKNRISTKGKNENNNKNEKISQISLKAMINDSNSIADYKAGKYNIVIDNDFLKRIVAKSYNQVSKSKSVKEIENKYLILCKNLGATKRIDPSILFTELDKYATNILLKKLFDSFYKQKIELTTVNINKVKNDFAKNELKTINTYLNILNEIKTKTKSFKSNWWINSYYHNDIK